MLKKKSSPLRSGDGCNVALLNEYRCFILKLRFPTGFRIGTSCFRRNGSE